MEEETWLSLVNTVFLFFQLYKNSVTVILNMPKIGELIQNDRFWRGVQSLLDALAILYDANNRLRVIDHSVPLLHEKFYIPEITDKVNIAMDYKNWYFASAKTRVSCRLFS